MVQHRLEARAVSKTFGSTRVLDNVELLVEPGEIHALIGQNGSGKSTVVKILTGYHAPDPGMTLALDGQLLELPVQWESVSAAGVSVVHQDLGLLDTATVAENIGVGGYIRSGFLRKIDWKAQRALAQELTDLVHGPDERAKVEAAASALFGRGDVAELDGPTLDAALAEAPSAVVTAEEWAEGITVADALARTGLVASRGAGRRTIAEGGAYVANVRVADENAVLTDADVLHGGWVLLRRGRRHIAGIRVERP